ncbi:MAG: hypothetical protein DRN31_03645 [Thermoplasmata archaeon]|nr:MAG: hypothetical protein DRN31_03645 [Thermoplasmata archaeon]
MGTKSKRKETDRKLKTNWKIYDLAMKYEDEWFIQNAKKVIDKMPEPWETSKMGRPPKHPPKSLVLALFIKTKDCRTYRNTESFLRENDRYKKLGFTSPPGKTTLQEAMAKLPEYYLEKLEMELSGILKKPKNI